jgi:hypothetical protein
MTNIRNLLFAIFILHGTSLMAQGKDSISSRKNLVKINLAALVFTHLSVQYERQIGRKTTFALGANVRPFGSVPFQSLAKKALNEDAVNFDKLKFSALGITPELRYYVGKKGAMRGFYFGPYFSYRNYKSDLPIKYGNDTKDGIFSGNIRSYTFGLQLGAQWKIGKNIYFDWWIIGPNYGSARGDMNLTTALSPAEQVELMNEIQSIKDDLPVDAIESYQVGPNGASIKVKGPWAGLRGMGFCLGYRF